MLGLLSFSICITVPLKSVNAEEEIIPNEFIFRVLLPPTWTISEAVFAYEHKGKYYLPLSELATGLDFFVDMELERGFASGFAGGDENKFTIDRGRNELIINEERFELAADAILDSDLLATDDLYVQMEIIDRMWPLDIRVDLSSLTVVMSTDEELPFMLKKERDERRAQAFGKREQQKKLSQRLPRKENPYSTLGKPAIDLQAIYTYDDEGDDINGANIITGVQQVGKMLADFSANFRIIDREFERPDNVRLRLSRRSAGQEYLVPGVRSVEFGDVNLRQRELIGNTENGRGLFVSNDNRDRFNEFDRTTLEGTAPPGWDIEIYNNDELIDFGVVPENGQYFFEDIVLNFGNNQIKILLFGPQGQVREEFRTFRAGGNMLRPGQFRYQAGLLDADREFILLANEPRAQPRGVVKNLETSYGVNRWLTVFGNYAELPDADKDRSYVSAGVAMSTKAGLVEAEAYNEIGGGNALGVDFITTFLGARANLGAAIYNDFESQDAGFAGNQKTFEANGQLNRTVRIGSVPLGLRLNTLHTERKIGDPISTVDFVQTLSRGGVRLSHNLSSRFSDYAHERTVGGFTTTVREGPWQLRGNFNYTWYPERELDSVNSELRYRTDNNFQAAFRAGHNFQTSDYNVGAQVGYEFEKVLGTIDANYQRQDGWEFILRATSSLTPYTQDGSYALSGTQKREYSPVRAKVFLDRDQDGVFGEGDEPIEGARLRVGSSSTQNLTDEDGVIIANVSADKLLNFKLDKDSLEDPYYVSASEGFSVVPARGGVVDAIFPVIETGAIEGTAYRKDTGRIVPGLTLELIGEDGEVAASAVSAFDGYYSFEFIKPGTYTIRAESSHEVDLVDNSVTIDADDLFIYGYDVFIDAASLGQEVATANQAVYGPFDDSQSAVIEGEGEFIGPVQAIPPQITEEEPGNISEKL